MNEQFFNEVKELSHRCVKKTADIPKEKSLIFIVTTTCSQDIWTGHLPLNTKNCHDYLELIVENHKDNAPVMEKLLGTEIISAATKLYAQIKKES